MGWFILTNIFSALLSFISIGRLPDHEKDLEILILRKQLAILQRKYNKPIVPNRADKMILAFSLLNISASPINKKLDSLILRLAKENLRWGYGKIEGELLKLGFKVSRTTIQNTLRRHNILPAPVRGGSVNWRHLLAHYKQQILATDFFTVDSIRPQTLYVLFFIELGSRRVHISGVTPNPNALRATQQARQLVWELDQTDSHFRFLIHDNDTKFSAMFDTVFSPRTLMSSTPLIVLLMPTAMLHTAPPSYHQE